MFNAEGVEAHRYHCRGVTAVPSLLKWTGSKRSQVAYLAARAPAFERYIEPFLGGGAMLYCASHPGALANDIYRPLIDLWRLVRDDPETLIAHYRATWTDLVHELESIDINTVSQGSGLPKTFYTVRERFNFEPNPIDLNFLMRTCVNGIVRFNDCGGFNNSFHLSRRGMNPDRFAAIVGQWNSVVQGVKLRSVDYRDILHTSKAGDFVYLDPPYAGTVQRYAEVLEPDELFSELDALNVKGVKWMLSYDGKRGANNLTYNVPRSLYKRHEYSFSGNSAVVKVLSGATERVEEGLYMNF